MLGLRCPVEVALLEHVLLGGRGEDTSQPPKSHPAAEVVYSSAKPRSQEKVSQGKPAKPRPRTRQPPLSLIAIPLILAGVCYIFSMRDTKRYMYKGTVYMYNLHETANCTCVRMKL